MYVFLRMLVVVTLLLQCDALKITNGTSSPSNNLCAHNPHRRRRTMRSWTTSPSFVSPFARQLYSSRTDDQDDGDWMEERTTIDPTTKSSSTTSKRKKQQIAKTRATRLAFKALNPTGRRHDRTVAERRKFKAAVGVYTRLLQGLDERASKAQERAKRLISEREACLASKRVSSSSSLSRLDHVQSIQQTREEEVRGRKLLEDLVLRETAPDDSILQGLSTEEMLAIVRIRGNLKGLRRVNRRDRVLQLLHESYKTPLY